MGTMLCENFECEDEVWEKNFDSVKINKVQANTLHYLRSPLATRKHAIRLLLFLLGYTILLVVLLWLLLALAE